MSKRGENIRKRSDGLWEARYVKEIDESGKKKYGSVYAHKYREVKEKRQAILDKQFLGVTPSLPRNITVNDLAKEWLALNQHRLKPSSFQRYCGYYHNHIENHIGKQNVLFLTPVNIHEFAADRQQYGLSPKTVNAVLVFLHSCLKYGERQYKLPIPEIVYLKVDDKEMRVLLRDEQKRLEKYLFTDMDVYKFGILLCLYSGLRIGELCGLQWSDIEENVIHVRRTVQRLNIPGTHHTELHIGPPKTKQSVRDIPLPDIFNPVLENMRALTGKDIYVLGGRTEPNVEPRHMQKRFQEIMSEVGLKNVTPHSLRHTFATRCVENNFETKSLSVVLGHKSVQTTMNLYVHTSHDTKQMNMNKLSFLG